MKRKKLLRILILKQVNGMDVIGGPTKNIRKLYSISKKLKLDVLQKIL